MKEDTIEQLFKRHYLDMYQLAKSYLYDGEASKDIVSDVFADLIDSPKVLLPQTTRQYLMTSVRNRCINIIRQKKLREQITHLHTAECIGEDSELLQQLYDFIDALLPQQDRDLFQMRFIDEMSYQEMMQATGLSRMTIYTHLSRTINLIKEHFNPTNK